MLVVMLCSAAAASAGTWPRSLPDIGAVRQPWGLAVATLIGLMGGKGLR